MHLSNHETERLFTKPLIHSRGSASGEAFTVWCDKETQHYLGYQLLTMP